MKALMYRGPWEMPVEEVERPAASSGRVVVEVKSVGICGSDVHGYTGSTGRRTPGIIMGHEFAGAISALGEGVEGFAPGDEVVVMPFYSVAEGVDPYAINRSPYRRMTGMNEHGAYAEQVAVRPAQLFRKPPQLSWTRAALCEPVAVTMHAVNITPIELMQNVVIIGAGPIGLLAMLAARLKGAGKLIVTDRSARRLELAEELGADVIINVDQQDAVKAIHEITGDGADMTLEAVGISPTAQQAIDVTRNGGHVTWIGNSAKNITIDMQSIVTREITVRGTYGFNEIEFAAAIDALAGGRLNVDALVERIATLDEASEIFRQLAKGEKDWVKVVVEPGA
jgi:L-iditol 2-dehydrogenase